MPSAAKNILTTEQLQFQLQDLQQRLSESENRLRSFLSLSHQTLVERARRFIRLGYRVDGVRNTETLHDGTARYFVNSSHGEIHDGQLVRVWITGRDVTYQTLVEVAAEQGEIELHRTAEQLDGAFWILDWNGFRVLYTGSAIQKRWGISRERLMEDALCWLESVHDAEYTCRTNKVRDVVPATECRQRTRSSLQVTPS